MSSFERAARAHTASRGAAGTRTIYEAALARWVTFCELEGVDVDAPTLEAATAFRDRLERTKSAKTGEALSPQFRRLTLSALSSMHKAAGVVNVFDGMRLTRPEADEVALTRELTAEEAEKLLVAARQDSHLGTRDAAIMQIIHDTGVRLSEALSIRRDRLACVGETYSFFVKTKKQGLVEVVLQGESFRRLKDWLTVASDSPFVFPSRRDPLKPVSAHSFGKRVKVYAERAGVVKAHAHRFRATFATIALNTMPLHEVRAAMHHADPNTTLRYDRGKRGLGVAQAVAEARRRRDTEEK